MKHLLKEEIAANNPGAKAYMLTAEDIAGIEQLAKEKYETWDWNFGFSPNYNFQKAIKVPAGFIEVHLDVVKGTIEKAKIFGDFFASRPVEELESKLIGLHHEVEQLTKLFESENLTEFFGNVTVEEVVEAFK